MILLKVDGLADLPRNKRLSCATGGLAREDAGDSPSIVLKVNKAQ